MYLFPDTLRKMEVTSMDATVREDLADGKNGCHLEVNLKVRCADGALELQHLQHLDVCRLCLCRQKKVGRTNHRIPREYMDGVELAEERRGHVKRAVHVEARCGCKKYGRPSQRL